MLILQQCKVTKMMKETIVPVADGMTGFEEKCASLDTIRTLLISKAETIISFNNERYETTVSLFVTRDSMIYLSAVNNGFEILRASIDMDSIKVIDRINRTVYRTAFYKRFGYQHPVDYYDLQNIISSYFLCDDSAHATDEFKTYIRFIFPDDYVNKEIYMNRSTYTIDEFRFYHTKTNKYIMGEQTKEGIRIVSNFLISDFEIFGAGGEITYNGRISVNMEVNPRKYSFVDFQ